MVIASVSGRKKQVREEPASDRVSSTLGGFNWSIAAIRANGDGQR